MFHRMTRSMLAALALGVAVTLAGARMLAPSAAWADASDLASAQQLYDSAKYADAVTQLKAALDGGKLSGGDAVRGRELLARCQVKAGDAAGAKKTFLALLRQDPLYRPDATQVPPDEMAAYEAAHTVAAAEQERQKQRIPASLGFNFGVGSGKNKDFGKFVASGGGKSEFDVKAFYGGTVRFPVKPRLSIELEMQRFKATNHDSFPDPGSRSYELTAIPLSVSLHYLMAMHPKWRSSVFFGGGPMVQSKAQTKFNFFGVIPLAASASKTAIYLHGGVEGEYLLHPRLSLTGRVLGRYAKASDLSIFNTTDFNYTTVPIKSRAVDFSGYGASIGLRAYIGY